MKTVCGLNNCNGCKACAEKCPKSAITIHDDVSHFNAIIDSSKCINCGICTKVCPNCSSNETNPPKEWFQGWDNSYRKGSSSGGIASAIMKNFIESGGYVAACVFHNGDFIFKLTNKVADIKQFQGSKYVKSNPSGVYSEIQHTLNEGHKVLFVGLPCQVAALKHYTFSNPNLYTADLICHGTPSPHILKTYLKECGYDIDRIRSIKFREKMNFCLIVDGERIEKKRKCDFYMHGFLNGLFYTENCYSCPFSKLERIGDLTLGDSWGSNLTNEINKGISLILVQNEKGKHLIDCKDISLFCVEFDNAIQNNHQLTMPSKRPSNRKLFFKRFNHNHKIKTNVAKAYPIIAIKNFIKNIIFK